MSFDWEDFFRYAEELGNSSSAGDLAAAKRRTAVSRAYYAAYNIACATYRTKHGDPPRACNSRHQDLQKALTDSDDDDEAEAGDKLGELRGYRNDADYYAERPIDQLQVMMSVMLAGEIIDAI